MALKNWLAVTGNTTTTASVTTTTWPSYATFIWSGSTTPIGNWSAWAAPEQLDETQIRQLKHILALVDATPKELRDMVDVLATETGDNPAETLKMLRTIRQLVLLGQLTEKLAR